MPSTDWSTPSRPSTNFSTPAKPSTAFSTPSRPSTDFSDDNRGGAISSSALSAFSYIFASKCDNVRDFTLVMDTDTEEVIEVWNEGVVGDAIAVECDYQAVTEVGVRREELTTSPRRVQFYFRMSGFLYDDFTPFHCWNGNYASDLFELQLDKVNSQRFKLRIKDIASNTTNTGTTNFDFDEWVHIMIEMTDTTVKVYANRAQAAECSLSSLSNSSKAMNVCLWGKYYSGEFSGYNYLDNILMLAATPSAPTTVPTKMADVYQGYMQRYYHFEGAIVRPPSEGVKADFSGAENDIISEGQAYGLLLAVHNNDQEIFDQIEQFCYTKMERRNHPTFASTLSSICPHLMGWHRNPQDWYGINYMSDWNWASDADLDRVRALIYAHVRWGSGGAINYLQRAQYIATDIRYSHNYYNGKPYLCGDFYGVGDATAESNQSYFDFAAYRLMDKYFGSSTDSFYRDAIDAAYDSLTKITDNSGTLATTVGLVPNWHNFTVATGEPATPNVGRDTKFTYDAFRAIYREYLDYYIYRESRAYTHLTGNYLTFLEDEWDTNAKIEAEYNHDGTVASAYEKGLMYGIHVFAFFARSLTDITGTTIYNTKVVNTYQQHPGGSYWSDNPNTPSSGNPTYYNSTWMLLSIGLKEALYHNYT